MTSLDIFEERCFFQVNKWTRLKPKKFSTITRGDQRKCKCSHSSRTCQNLIVSGKVTIYFPVKKRQKYDFDHAVYVHKAHTPTIKMKWVYRYTLNVCLHYFTSRWSNLYRICTHEQRIKDFVSGSSHQHLHISFFFIFAKPFHCILNDFSLKMTLKRGNKNIKVKLLPQFLMPY